MVKETLEPKDVEWANDLLRYAIAHLRGENVVSSLSGRICIALLLKRRLEERGFWWQARIVEAWIHRAQGGEFS
jgi:hypothetical protein